MKKYIIASVKNGKFIYDVEDMKYIASTFPDNKQVQITFELVSEKKTKKQLGYFFAGIIKGAAEMFGWEEEEMYKWLMSECNKQAVVNKFSGEISYCAFGLSRCDKAEMIAVTEKAIRLLAEHGYVVSEPIFRQSFDAGDTSDG